MSEPAFGLVCLAVAVVVAMATIATIASSIAARRLLVFSGNSSSNGGRGACYGTREWSA